MSKLKDTTTIEGIPIQTSTENMTLTSVLRDLKSLVKSIVLVLNVMPVLAGYLLALYFTGGHVSEHVGNILLILLASTLIIAGALIINNWYEVDLDRHMVRTENRPTVTGHFSLETVLWLGIATTTIGFALILFTTLEAAFYAFIGWFTYVVLYTFWSKRKYTLNTVIGSVSGAVTPLIGWGAVTSTYHIIPVMLFILLFVWQIPHTFAIAMRRYDDYKAANVPMLPVVAGFAVTKRQMLVWILALLPIPFFMTSLGLAFVIIATTANVIWLVITISGFYLQDDVKWANMMFRSSLIYLTILFFLMIVISIV
ncbi:heme o synthase [Virgibacillus soli]|uniref:heme o synthase n=1 Tax=Paracerasibacillus soli TaxID=480284 RepID=UPI0035E8E434